MIENIEKYDIVLLLYEDERNLTIKDVLRSYLEDDNDLKIALIVGPEGGFSDDEIHKLISCNRVKCVTLGKRILRTETAGLAAVSMLVYEFDL